jgi:hypothetical protein
MEIIDVTGRPYVQSVVTSRPAHVGSGGPPPPPRNLPKFPNNTELVFDESNSGVSENTAFALLCAG